MEHISFKDLSPSEVQHIVSKKFKLKSKELPKTRKQLCFPKHFEYQLPQIFVREFINPTTPYKALLLYHKIGSGKTCAAIQIAEQWKGKRRVIIVTPASLKSNMYSEFRSECTGTSYISHEERKILKELDQLSPEYHKLIRNINKRIDKEVKILSHNKFISLIQNNEINLRNSLLIIDEVHNIVSESGTFYNTLHDFILKSPDSLRIVLLTATPIVDKPYELGLTINLLKPKKEFPTGHMFNKEYIDETNNTVKNSEELANKLKGYVSYYKGAPNKVFPLKEYKVVNCKMSKYQSDLYSRIKTTEDHNTDRGDDNYLNIDNNFYVNSRIASNVTFPDDLMGNKGYKMFSKMDLANPQILRKYSCKLSRLLTKLQYSRGTVFIYSNFKEIGGIKTLIRVLEANGYSDFIENGHGIKRFALWTGDEPVDVKEKILTQFNDLSNQNGSRIKILLGSPSIKEGVSLLRVREVHILEPHWNMSRIQQVIGRAIRFCSHKDVMPLRRLVRVYLYVAKIPKGTGIDQHILNIAHKKEEIIKQFERVLIDSAVDKMLY
jgi:superfamily II DNA or RNA helicase